MPDNTKQAFSGTDAPRDVELPTENFKELTYEQFFAGLARRYNYTDDEIEEFLRRPDATNLLDDLHNAVKHKVHTLTDSAPSKKTRGYIDALDEASRSPTDPT